MSKNDFIVNGEMAAMPVSVTLGPSGDFMTSADYGYTGLTKREHFAAMAMQGLCSTYKPENMGDDGSDARICAKYAIEHADALLAALEKQ